MSGTRKPPTGARTIGVMSSLALKAACMELMPRFERESGLSVLAQFVGGVEIGKRLRAGDPSELVIMAAAAIDEFVKQGLIVPGSRVDLVRSRIGMAVRSGAPRPDISTGVALQRAVESASAVAYSTGPSGVYIVDVFKRWGIPADKLRQSPPGVPAGDFVVRGDAEIAFQQISELLPLEGIDYVGPLPDELQLVTVFSGGTNVCARDPDAAQAFTDFLTAPEAIPVLESYGLEPA
jgi:molybdate transport system substrate-binding protein